MTDQEYFKDSILHINSQAALNSFIDEYTLGGFNSALNGLSGEDYRSVTGRIERIRINELFNSTNESQIGQMLQSAEAAAELRKAVEVK
jgi:hypothetical protein